MSAKPRWGQRGEWYVAVQILLFALIFLVPLLGPKLVQWPSPWDMIATMLGLALGLIGALMILFGILSLGPNLTAVPYPKEDAVLVQRGAYRFVRHPIYSGIILGALGWGLLTNSLLALLLALVLFIFFDVKSRREERWLCDKYADYADYQARVRKLIPFVY